MTVDFASGRRTSPLGARAEELASAGIFEIPYRSMIDLRVDSTSSTADRIGTALGLALPVVPNTVCANGSRAAMWLGPDEWLLLGEDGDRIAGLAMTALGEDSGSVVDVSANRTTIELRGPNARELLAKGCALDLHPRAFSTGHCVQTLLGKVQVILWQTSAEPSYQLLVRCSFANYLADWLLDAAASRW